MQLDSWPLPDGVREQIVVPPDDEGALRGILIELSRKKSAYVDILIPEGRHLLSEGVSSQAMGVSGMRLKGVEGTVLVGTLRVDGCRDVVLEDLTLEGERTSALWALGHRAAHAPGRAERDPASGASYGRVLGDGPVPRR